MGVSAPSLPGCASPGVRAPCPKEGSAHCLSVPHLDRSTGWSELSFEAPLIYGNKADLLSEEGDSQRLSTEPLRSLMPNKWGISQWRAICEL